MDHPPLVRQLSLISRIAGHTAEACIPGVAIGEICEIRRTWREPEVVGQAQVIAVHDDRAILSLFAATQGLSCDSALLPTGRQATCRPNDAWRGAVLDASGGIVDRIDDGDVTTPGPASLTGQTSSTAVERTLLAPALPYEHRVGVAEGLHTGLRAIDALMPCGIGQRVGIFAPAGCGKTSFLSALMAGVEVDTTVIALIGERGREVVEIVDELRASPGANRCVVIFATSDAPAVTRRNAALLATTVSEHFRDQGHRVALFVDSLTRYVRACRDLALATGELPMRAGVPASVYTSLPQLLERAGASKRGSITAFYTVLMEDEEMPDPMVEEIRSILDGHIHLSAQLAHRSHYPAIDVLRSVSRVATRVATADHIRAAGRLRAWLARLEALQTLVDLGEYRPGVNAQDDEAMDARPRIEAFLQQGKGEWSSADETLGRLHEIVG
ncbi:MULTISPECIES: EscN/YscN/HrcN family type III secretion system ATPase [Pandoraea]|uniref:EscN/YscN/HrcN family type III secretion system ATPase n=1 Tax=Pandoraea TaxID=93217 RepID=UPI001F5C2D05|nr:MULTISPECIES: EscN/YscN/HrcN family type III secretion system ATPase [Pandoraea]MCI3207293.1 EscN/YscN/HrcN family type III secretion system ATPase [Pandoraea sp. LA3]MDN4585322.1 EscN/YscN/HrcN family type III secretion system ATPase [Pandoraea capi]